MQPTHKLQKFSSQADAQLLAALHTIAKEEGRQFQAIVDEAFHSYVEAKKTGRSRPHVLRAFDVSLKTHDDLYRKLAK